MENRENDGPVSTYLHFHYKSIGDKLTKKANSIEERLKIRFLYESESIHQHVYI